MSGKISIILPCHNAGSTLPPLFDSLVKQNDPQMIEEITVINDNSSDNSEVLIDGFIHNNKIYSIKKITHTKSRGLAASYNEGLLAARGEYVILMHADIILTGVDSFSKMMKPLVLNYAVSSPFVITPRQIWSSYNFWQKCFFSRCVENRYNTMSGKFNCFKKKLLLSKVGLFDSQTFRTAGEDVDMQIRLRIAGLKEAKVDLDIIHVHSRDNNFGLKSLIKKEAQYAEANGALLKKYGPVILETFNVVFFRQGLVLMLFLPLLKYLSLVMILLYSFIYSKNMYRYEYRNAKILLLPFVNIYLLFIHLFYSVKGFIYGRQRI